MLKIQLLLKKIVLFSVFFCGFECILLLTSCNSNSNNESAVFEDLLKEHEDITNATEVGFLLKLSWSDYQSPDLSQILTKENLSRGTFPVHGTRLQLDLPISFVHKKPVYVLVLFRNVTFQQSILENGIAERNGRLVDDTKVVSVDFHVMSKEVRVFSLSEDQSEIEEKMILGFSDDEVNKWSVFNLMQPSWKSKLEFYDEGNPLERWLKLRIDPYTNLSGIELLLKKGKAPVYKLEKGSFKNATFEEIKALYSLIGKKSQYFDDSYFYEQATTNESEEADSHVDALINSSDTAEVQGAVKLYSIQDPDGYTNLRATPGGKIIRKVYENETFDIIQPGVPYSKIKLTDGTVGYLHNSRIKSVN